MARTVALSHGLNTKWAPYADALTSVGLEAVHFTPAAHGSLDGVFGLVLCGGADIEPSRYGQTRHPETKQRDDERDGMELELIEEALRRDLPILAICRGMQVLNVRHGGSLHQHIGDSHRPPPGQVLFHPVSVAEASCLLGITGRLDFAVNSRHHQAVDRVGDSLRAIAWSHDGYIEAIERTDRSFVVGVQWHPEDTHQTNEPDACLFRAFRDAVSR